MHNIIKYAELSSTNMFALDNLDNLDDHTIIQAEVQTTGRGRFQRKWISDKPDNCYISFVLKPDIKYKNNFPNITQYLSVILCDELINGGVKPFIKWPNDVLINEKKIAGILSEISFVKEDFIGIVVGIGVNLNLTKSDLINIDIPATSLNLELNRTINSTVFIASLVERFFAEYEQFLKKGFPYIKARYIGYSNFLNKEIKIKNPDLQHIGKVLDVNEDGSLKIQTHDGEKNIFSGDVIF